MYRLLLMDTSISANNYGWKVSTKYGAIQTAMNEWSYACRFPWMVWYRNHHAPQRHRRLIETIKKTSRNNQIVDSTAFFVHSERDTGGRVITRAFKRALSVPTCGVIRG